MTDDLPPPLTPPDCDLRDFGFMPLEIERLQRSAAWRRAKRKPALGFYMVNLWVGAFHEIPAGSIEDNDEALADLAQCDPKRWLKIKDDVLVGWIRCADGRLYHRVVAEKALEAWIEKLGQRKSSGIGNAKRWQCAFDVQEIDKQIATAIHLLRSINAQSRVLTKKTARTVGVKTPDAIPDRSQPDPEGIPVGSQGTGTGTGTGTGKVTPLPNGKGRQAAAPPEGENPPKGAKPDPWKFAYDRGKEVFGRSAGGIITNLRKTLDDKPHKVMAKIEDAAEKRNPVEWINAFLWEYGPAGIQVGAVSPIP